MKARAVGVVVSLMLSIFLVPLGAGRQSGDDPRLHVRIETSNPPALAAALDASGVAVVSVDRKGRAVEAVVTSAQLDRLNQSGLRASVINRTRPLAETLTAPSAPGLASSAAVALAVAPATYRDLDGVVARMYEIALAYPAIAQVVDLTATYNTPPTVQGRHMFALKISDNVAVDEDEPSAAIRKARRPKVRSSLARPRAASTIS